MATEINAGRVAMVPKGEWDSTTAYTRLDVVQHGGSAWVCIQDGTGQEPASGSTYWQLLAAGIKATDYYTKPQVDTALQAKQDALVSGQNIKSINGQSVLGEGGMTIHEAQLIDKSYAPAEFSGLGRKYLQKNIVSNKNVLTQAMLNDANTIYVIQYDFTLGEDITVPADCVLEFDGGSISGKHTLIGSNTGIEADLIKIFNKNITLDGAWNIRYLYSEWFGAVGNGVNDDTQSFQKAIDTAASIGVILKPVKKYAVTNLFVRHNCFIEGKKNAVINHIGNGICLSVQPPADITSWNQFVRCKITDIIINLNSNSTIGVLINQCVGSLFENIVVNGVGTGIPETTAETTKGFFIDGTTSVESTKNSIFNNTYRRIEAYKVDICFDVDGVFSDSKFYNLVGETANEVLRMYAVSSWNISIFDCQFVNMNVGIHIQGFIGNGFIRGCNIENYKVYGIYQEAGPNNSIFMIENNGLMTIYGDSITNDLRFDRISNSCILCNRIGYSDGTLAGSSIDKCMIHGNASGTNKPLSFSDKIKNMNFCFGYSWISNKDAIKILGNTCFESLLIGNETNGTVRIDKSEDSIVFFDKGDGYYGIVPTGVTSEQLSLTELHDSVIGTHVFSKEHNKPIWKYNDFQWREYDGVRPFVKRSGHINEIPYGNQVYIGFMYYVTNHYTPEGNIAGFPIYFAGQDTTDPDNPVDIWVDALGRKVDQTYPAKYKGAFDNKPTLTSDDAGWEYKDTTYNRIIIWDGTAWIDATGTPV